MQGQNDTAPPMRSKLTLWQHITAATWPNGHRVYSALGHDYISDVRIKKTAEEERKDGHKEERKGELKIMFHASPVEKNSRLFCERFLLQNKCVSLMCG